MSTVPKSVCSSMEEDLELRRGPWTVEEDCVLTHYVACHGEGRWNQLSKCAGLKRTGKSCRLRWLNYLKPDVKRGNITPKEQLLILELHSMWGNRWSKIAKYLPGRTDNEIKNYWRTRVQKQAKHLKIDCDSTRFQDMIRCYWIPRLLQKMESSSPSTATMNPQSSSAPAPLLNDAHQTPPIIPQACLNPSKPTESCNRPELNSSSEKCTNPSVSFSDSINTSQLPEVSEHPSSSHALDCVISDALQTNCYHVDSCGYGMEAFNLASTSAPGDFTNSVHCCHLPETHWADDEVANSVWNLDEFMNNFHKDLSTHSGKACLN